MGCEGKPRQEVRALHAPSQARSLLTIQPPVQALRQDEAGVELHGEGLPAFGIPAPAPAPQRSHLLGRAVSQVVQRQRVGERGAVLGVHEPGGGGGTSQPTVSPEGWGSPPWAPPRAHTSCCARRCAAGAPSPVLSRTAARSAGGSGGTPRVPTVGAAPPGPPWGLPAHGALPRSPAAARISSSLGCHEGTPSACILPSTQVGSQPYSPFTGMSKTDGGKLLSNSV